MVRIRRLQKMFQNLEKRWILRKNGYFVHFHNQLQFLKCQNINVTHDYKGKWHGHIVTHELVPLLSGQKALWSHEKKHTSRKCSYWHWTAGIITFVLCLMSFWVRVFSNFFFKLSLQNKKCSIFCFLAHTRQSLKWDLPILLRPSSFVVVCMLTFH